MEKDQIETGGIAILPVNSLYAIYEDPEESGRYFKDKIYAIACCKVKLLPENSESIEFKIITLSDLNDGFIWLPDGRDTKLDSNKNFVCIYSPESEQWEQLTEKELESLTNSHAFKVFQKLKS